MPSEYGTPNALPTMDAYLKKKVSDSSRSGILFIVRAGVEDVATASYDIRF
jgi:hypothetical protein